MELPLSLNQSFAKRDAPPDGVKTLLELANELMSGALKTPPHQRSNDAWNLERKRRWIQRNRDVEHGRKSRPLGTLCIYLLADDNHQNAYLNEGLQRVSAAVDALNHPAKYCFPDRDGVEALLRGSYVHVQYRHYNTHGEAASDFEEVNNGVTLHIAEKHKHLIVYSPNWASIWEPQFSKWSTELVCTLASYTKSAQQRDPSLQRERSTRHLFAVAHLLKPLEGGNKDDEVERCVVEAFSKIKPDDVAQNIRRMKDYSAQIEQAWRETHPEVGRHMNERLARWCLGVMFLNELKPDLWQRIFVTLFNTTHGDVNLSEHRENRAPKNHFLTSKFGCFHTVCKVLGIDIPEKTRRKSNSKLNIKAGFQKDHLYNYADNGDDGPTQIIAGRVNAAKCAREPKAGT